MSTATLIFDSTSITASFDPVLQRLEELAGSLRETKDKVSKKLERKSKQLAGYLHEKKGVYALYGGVDGFSISYSAIKLGFDLRYASSELSSTDQMHEALSTPGGYVLAATLSLGLVAFSALGNYFDDEDQNTLKRYIAILWPYVRELKWLKNAYKGCRSTLQIISTLSEGADLKYLFVPIGVALGTVSVMNRLWYRSMINQRKEMMKTNALLLYRIQTEKEIVLADLDLILEEIKQNRQTNTTRGLLLASSAYNGVVDGLYLYMGVFSICTLPPPILIAMLVFSTIYFLTCIATRLYEEYDYQQKLLIAQLKVELAAEGKKIELLVKKLQRLPLKLNDDPLNQTHLKHLAKQDKLQTLLNEAADAFMDKQQELRYASSMSYTTAFLYGARNGLSAYGALTSMMFIIGMTLPASAFPPSLLVVVIVLGMALLIAFIVHSLYRHHQYQAEQVLQLEKCQDNPELQPANVGKLFKQAINEVKALKPEFVKKALLEGMVVDPSPQFFFQEWFEVVRSFFSGMSKGIKSIDLALNPLETTDQQGHYHESKIMVGFMVVMALIQAPILALRAYARGFGRAAIDAVPGGSDMEIELNTFSSVGIDGTTDEDSSDEDSFKDADVLSIEKEGLLKIPKSPKSVWSSSEHSFFSLKERDLPNTKSVKVRSQPQAYSTLFHPHNKELVSSNTPGFIKRKTRSSSLPNKTEAGLVHCTQVLKSLPSKVEISVPDHPAHGMAL